MSCKVCEFFKEARRDALFWVKIGYLDGYAMRSRFIVREELNCCPTCGIELKTLREDTNEQID